jgi:starch synthase
MTIRAALLAAECEPWAKTGGLADVVDALARALGRIPDPGGGRGADGGLQVPLDVMLPRYRGVFLPESAVAEPVLVIPDPRDGAPLPVTILDVPADGYRLRLVDLPAAFDRDGYYDFPDDAWRFAVFCRAALAALKRDGTPLDVLHVHDWHTGPALLERARGAAAGDPFFADMAVVLTLHNLAYHGWIPADRIDELGLVPGESLAGANPDGVDLLLTAIERSEVANTVSPGFAAEALTPAFGMGLDPVLRALGDRFSGILNGIDPVVWDPATDPALAAPYDRGDLSGKAACRADLLTRVGFDPADDRVVLGMIGRMDPQKGFDLLADGAPRLLAAGARIIVQGSGHAVQADPFRALAAANPGRVALIERFDREMARRIYAGADLFLMPSRFEPCGQGQMIALRYGTPPVVRRTGGLADSVVDANDDPGSGTGFVFDEASPGALVAAVRRATALRSDATAWAALRDRGMAVDFNWVSGAAPRYLDAYRKAIALRRGKRRIAEGGALRPRP